MKRISYPPIIILLDVLFVFLFILILDEKKVIQIHSPEKKIFTGATIVHYDSNRKKYLDNNNLEYTFKGIYNLLLDCNEQIECIEAKQKYGTEKIFILLPRKLFTEMSEINMLAFGTEKCDKLEFFITKDGLLDNKKLIDENECLLKIDGFKIS